MTLAAHRPARPLSSLQGEDPAEVAVGLPGLPSGATLDPQVLRDAACGEDDLELSTPTPATWRPSALPSRCAPPARCAGRAWRWPL
jgi:hypothetical protein